MQLKKTTIVHSGSHVIGYVEPSRWCQDAGTDRCEAFRLRHDRTYVPIGRYASARDAANALMAAELGRKGPEQVEFVDAA